MNYFLDAIILIVDDDAAQVLIVKSVLERAGYRTMTASSGHAAMDIVRDLKDPLQLLLTDLEMPGMSGQALAAEMHAVQPDLPVLYLTAHADDLFSRGGILDSREAFLEKPVTAQALGEAVRHLLRRGAHGAA